VDHCLVGKLINTKKASKAEKRLAENVSRSHKLHPVEQLSVVGCHESGVYFLEFWLHQHACPS
jgi:hypothetical protein